MRKEVRLTRIGEVDAFVRGYVDGLEQPDELTSRMTYPTKEQNEAYDQGVDCGQETARRQR